MGHGKTEAYFFPPLNVPPYNLDLDAIKTRLGLRPGTTKEQVYNGYLVRTQATPGNAKRWEVIY